MKVSSFWKVIYTMPTLLNSTTLAYTIVNWSVSSISDVVEKTPSVQLHGGGFRESKTLTVEPVSFNLHPIGQNAEKFQIDEDFVLLKSNLHDADPTQLNNTCLYYSQLKQISFPDFSDNEIDLRLGQHNFDLI